MARKLCNCSKRRNQIVVFFFKVNLSLITNSFKIFEINGAKSCVV